MPYKKIFFSFSIILIFLGLIELFSIGILTLLDDNKGKAHERLMVYHPLTIRAYKPNSKINHLWPTLVTDDNGYIRSRPYIDNADLTILLTGASSARNQQPYTSYDKSIAGIIESSFLKNEGIKVSVINLAMPGFSNFQELMSIYNYLEEKNLSADFIISTAGLSSIMQFGNNLAANLKGNNIYPLYNQRVTNQIRGRQEGSFYSVTVSLNRYLKSLNISTVSLITKLTQKNNRRRVEVRGQIFSDNELKNEKTDLLYQRLIVRDSAIIPMMKILAESKGATVKFFLLPSRYTWKSSPELIANEYYQNTKLMIDKYYEALQKNTPEIDLVNLNRIFNHLPVDSTPFTGKQRTHYNEFGTEIIANVIYQEIKDEIINKHRDMNTKPSPH